MQTDSVIDARAEFSARAIMTKVERLLAEHGDDKRYDVYSEWYEDEPADIQIWLRDRMDNSRIGPLDLVAIKIVE